MQLAEYTGHKQLVSLLYKRTAQVVLVSKCAWFLLLHGLECLCFMQTDCLGLTGFNTFPLYRNCYVVTSGGLMVKAKCKLRHGVESRPVPTTSDTCMPFSKRMQLGVGL